MGSCEEVSVRESDLKGNTAVTVCWQLLESNSCPESAVVLPAGFALIVHIEFSASVQGGACCTCAVLAGVVSPADVTTLNGAHLTLRVATLIRSPIPLWDSGLFFILHYL